MGLVVQKYGGTSVGTIERIKAVADRVVRTRDAGNRIVVVVSAMAGETNRLFKLASELSEAPSARETDVLVATGRAGLGRAARDSSPVDGASDGFLSRISDEPDDRLESWPRANQIRAMRSRDALA